MLELLQRLTAINSYAKDCHYNYQSFGQHQLADVNQEELLDYKDLINEVCYLGLGADAPESEEVLSGALNFIPEVSEDDQENLARLKLLVKMTLIHIEEMKLETRGIENLIGAISQDLQQLHGLLYKVVDDEEDFKYLEKLQNAEKDDELEWITVKGNHIPVKKGQTKEEAVKEFLDKKEKVSEDNKDDGSDKKNVFDRINESFANLEKEVAERKSYNEKIKEKEEENLKEFSEKYNDWQENVYNKKIEKYAKLAEENENARWIKISEKDSISLDDVKSGNIKGVKNSKGKVKETAEEFLKGWGNPKEIKDFFNEGKPEFKSLKKDVEWIDNPIKKEIEAGYIGQKYKTSFYIPRISAEEISSIPNYRDLGLSYEPVLKEIGEILKKDGWERYHKSGNRIGDSSSYYEKDGQTIRLSNHELPNTEERRYKTETGQRRGWDYEYVPTQRDLVELYAAKDKKELKKLIDEKIGFSDEVENQSDEYERIVPETM